MHARFTMVALFAIALGATGAQASHYDGKGALICSIYQLFECDPPNACIAVSPDEVSAMSHFYIDFKKKVITRAGIESSKKSTIQGVHKNIDGKLIIQGVEDGAKDERDGAGWSISIMDPEGTMVMATAGDGFAIVGLGACVPKP